jgi:hypothetical protein
MDRCSSCSLHVLDQVLKWGRYFHHDVYEYRVPMCVYSYLAKLVKSCWCSMLLESALNMFETFENPARESCNVWNRVSATAFREIPDSKTTLL